MVDAGKIRRPNWVARLATAFLLGSLFLSLGLGASSSKDSFTSRQREYWAFQEVKRPAVPEWEGSGEVHNPIDAFVLRKLQEKGLKPASLADKVTLIRRASFDLIGLPELQAAGAHPHRLPHAPALQAGAPPAHVGVPDSVLGSAHDDAGSPGLRHHYDGVDTGHDPVLGGARPGGHLRRHLPAVPE